MKFVTFLLALAYTATVAMASETKECEGVCFYPCFDGHRGVGVCDWV